MVKASTAVALLCFLSLSRLAVAAPAPKPGVLHYRANGKLASVPVRVNGSRPLWFVFDTGARHTLVDSATALSIGLQVVSQGQGKGAGAGTYVQWHAPPIDVTVGPVVLHVPDPWVIDLAHVGTAERTDGLLGADLLARYVVRIDPVAHALTLIDSTAFHYEGKGAMLPLTNTDNRLYVDVQLTLANGISETHAMRLDTGSEDAASDNLVRRSPERRLARQGVGLGTAYVDTSGVFASVELGPYAVHRAWGASNDRPALGMEILRRFTMTFDVPHARLFLEPNSDFADPVPAPSQ